MFESTRRVGILVLLCTAVATTSFGQVHDYDDILLLNNGGTITGKIIDNVPGKKVTIERADGMVFKVPSKKIFAITDADNLEQHRRELQGCASLKRNLLRGWKNTTWIGPRWGAARAYMSAGSVSGVYFGERIFLSLGLGYDYWPVAATLPIFFHARVYEGGDLVRVFVYGDLGYALGWVEGVSGCDRGGTTFGFGAGGQMNAGTGPMPIILAGYRYQATGEYPTGQRIGGTAHYLTISVGIVF
ncbi:MAG: hypothetical protein HY770_03065 [Chitinivibrionia bacterium]|nr:hypothetical protein [Chitinivibrionia bacterium]